MMKLIIT